MKFSDFIGQKGPQTLADVLNVRVGTVYSWSSRGVIPRDVWPDLLLAYPELGMRDLLDMERASKEGQ